MSTPPPNPYAPPVAEGTPILTPDGPQAELEAIRNAHLSSETNIKSIGSLAVLGAVLQLLGGLAVLTRAPAEAVIQLVVCFLLGAVGFLLRGLNPVGRIIYTVLLGLGMLSTVVSLGLAPGQGANAMYVALFTMALGGLFLWVLWNAKARVVFTQHYREVVIRQTPYIKYKTSKVAIAVLILLVLGLIAAIASAIAS